MALEKAFHTLTACLQALCNTVQEVRLTVVEDRPVSNEAVIVDHYEYRVEDIMGWLEEAVKSASTAAQATGSPVDLDRARRALAKCQELFHRVQKRYGSDLISYWSMDELTTFARQRRGEWQAWSESVKRGLEQCREPMEEASAQLSQCWEELTEHLGTTNVSVHTTTNIGQLAGGPEGVKIIEQERMA